MDGKIVKKTKQQITLHAFILSGSRMGRGGGFTVFSATMQVDEGECKRVC